MRKSLFIPKSRGRKSFDSEARPALEANPGDVVTFETSDSAYESLWLSGKIDHGGYNVVTGPLRVRGAEPGDALKIGVLDVEITRAWAVWFPQYGLVRTDRLQIRPVKIARDRILLNNKISIALKPMIGCIGVAPAKGASSTYEPVYPWGGNMDLTQIKPGAVLYLPVQTRGALLSVGDLHASMGEAEAACVGLEAAGRVVLKVDLAKRMRIPAPRIRVDGTTVFVGIGDNPDAARAAASALAWKYLTKELKLPEFEAFAFFSACVDLRFGGPASEIVLAAVPDP